MRETESRHQIAIDLSRVETAAQLHPTLAASLEFPEHYGQNWDAITSDRPLPPHAGTLAAPPVRPRQE
jgi:Barstar (barnase inhibitor)